MAENNLLILEQIAEKPLIEKTSAKTLYFEKTPSKTLYLEKDLKAQTPS